MPLFFIEGNIGAGKSTLLRNLEDAVMFGSADAHVVILEPVEEWCAMKDVYGTSIFEHFYADMPRNGFTFQIYILATRIKSILDVVKTYPDKVVFCERSFLTDINIFAKGMRDSGTITDIEWRVFQHVHAFITSEINIAIDGVLYLRCDPDVCMQRIQVRGRGAEEAIEREYIQKLHDAHEDWYGAARLPKMTIDGNRDLREAGHWADVQSDIVDFVRCNCRAGV